MAYVRWFADVSNEDVPVVGGKNASLGELMRGLRGEDVRVPDGFATTADAYWAFVDENGIRDQIRDVLGQWADGTLALREAGAKVRRLFSRGRVPEQVAEEIRAAYRDLSQRYRVEEADVAVRSSATAEDLPSASFAGQQETFLNTVGEEELLSACRRCYASLFTDRAIAYRQDQGFDQLKVALSIGVQKMVRSDLAGAGVMFTIDTETGFPNMIVINANWGLGETVVQGTVNPDEYRVFTPLLGDAKLRPIVEKVLGGKARKIVYADGGHATRSVDTSEDERRAWVLSDDEILALARWGAAIERHYGRPMDTEWAKDGQTGELFIVQARPETVQSQRATAPLNTYRLEERGQQLLKGIAIGSAIAAGKALVIRNPREMDRFEDGAVLVTGMTDPDWVPIMRRASAIVTDHGGRTSHAAIVSRELGVPAIVGTGEATHKLHDGQEITVSCAEGETGYVYDGRLKFTTAEVRLEDMPKTQTRIMMNIATPAAAFRWWRLPVHGIGLARMEFVINNEIKIHPTALLKYPDLADAEATREIERLTAGYDDKAEFFVERLASGIARIAASQYPDPVLIRTSDFKTNEYAELIGGREFEPHEENPMLGWRGASRYYDPRYRDGFALECRAIKRAREEIGLSNVVVMIPFCRTPEEARQVLDVMAENGLRRGENGLQVYVMAEIPSNIVLTEEFAALFDGFSIGSNDLTQLLLGVDRDNADLAKLFQENHEAVKRTIRDLIERAHRVGTPVGICGQAPSDHPDFAAFLAEAGIDSISLNPDSVIATIRRIAEAEAQVRQPVGAGR